MSQEIVLQRGKRAGNILLIGALVGIGFVVFDILFNTPRDEIVASLIGEAIVGLIGIVLLFLLISPLKNDNIKGIRIIYIIMNVLWDLLLLLMLYNMVKDPNYLSERDDAIQTLLYVPLYAPVLIALYHFGKTGKILCYIAAGISLLTVFLTVGSKGFDLYSCVSGVFEVVFYILLGLYIESKGPIAEKTSTPPPESGYGSYDELIKLKELMDRGVITPAEYEAKKKQVLGL